MTTTEKSYSVYDYQTGEKLEGRPSRLLVEDSLEDPNGTGAVLAFPLDGVWRIGADTDPGARTVFVQED